MPRNREIAVRKRCQPKPEIEPIHVDELLGAAGMSGFLGVLEPPTDVPHLAEPFADPPLAELAVWFSNRVEATAGGLRRQQESLYGLTQLARHLCGSAERLALITKDLGERKKRQWQTTSEGTELVPGAA